VFVDDEEDWKRHRVTVASQPAEFLT
jgi:hypothetical protein